MQRNAVIAVGVIVFVACLPQAAWSQCDAPKSMCAAYGDARLVFVGYVEAVRLDPQRRKSIQFRVEERVKGPIGERVNLLMKPSSEDFEYAVGQSVLVYANASGDAWNTSCTRTKQVASAWRELRALRALVLKQTGGVISGHVPMSRRSTTSPPARVVVLREGRVVDEVVAGNFGLFDTAWLLPGTYEVVVPPVRPQEPAVRRTIEVPQGPGCVWLDAARSQGSRGGSQSPQAP